MDENLEKNHSQNNQKKRSPTSVIVVYNSNHIYHKTNLSSPESPERLTNMLAFIKHESYLFRLGVKMLTRFRSARIEDVLRVHTRKHIDNVVKASSSEGFFEDSTYFTSSTANVALKAAGGAIEAGRRVANGSCKYAFAAVRPPGHHAGTETFGGFCIYNNAAILARYLQEVKGIRKIMIVDWDAHSANGTMEIFYDDPTVMLVSIHQDPKKFYPYKGFAGQVGKGDGLGYTVNLELPKGSGDSIYKMAFNDLILPTIEDYRPDFIIGCNGFDIHHSDIYTDLNVTANGIYDLVSRLSKNREGRLALLMEGGYHLNNGRLTATVLNALLRHENPYMEDTDSLNSVVASTDKNYKIVKARIELLSRTLKDIR